MNLCIVKIVTCFFDNAKCMLKKAIFTCGSLLPKKKSHIIASGDYGGQYGTYFLTGTSASEGNLAERINKQAKKGSFIGNV